MHHITCPYCSSLKNVVIVCNDNIAPKISGYSVKCNQNRLKNNDAILSNWNLHYSKDYDGKIVKRKTYDRYCFECNRPFYYISNLIIGDIKELTFIIQTTNNDRWKYELHFTENNSYYNVDHNYFTKEYEASLTPARKRKILQGIDNSNFLNWKPLKEKNYFDYKIKWNVYIVFYNEQTYSRGGYDEYPNEWSIFIEPFIKVFKNEIFKK